MNSETHTGSNRCHNAKPWSRSPLRTYRELTDHLRDLSLCLGEKPHEIRALLWDEYFTLCAMWQVLEDFLHPRCGGGSSLFTNSRYFEWLFDFLPWRVANLLKNLAQPILVKLLGSGIDAVAALRLRARLLLRDRSLPGLSDLLRKVTAELALVVIQVRDMNHTPEASVLAQMKQLISEILTRPYPTDLDHKVLKIPACFKDFDCHPDDCQELVKEFARTAVNRAIPVTVLGIRTSGSYLAPLCFGYLRLQGFTDVTVESVRPGTQLCPEEKKRLRRRILHGPALIVDDPPYSGGTLVQTVRILRKLGARNEHIVPLILQERGAPFFEGSGDGKPPLSETELRGNRMIVLAPERWRAHRVVDLENLQKNIGNLLKSSDERVKGFMAIRVTPLISPPRQGGDTGAGWTAEPTTYRCHKKVIVEGQIITTEGFQEARFAVKGCGLGWFEDHVLAIAGALSEFIPRTRLVMEGFIIAPWIEGVRAVDRPDAVDEDFIKHAARYVARRAERLSLEPKMNIDVDDRETGWHTLAKAFARSSCYLTSLATRRLCSRLMRIPFGAPQVAVDGKMGPEEWILPVNGNGALKLDFEEHDFDREDTCIFDPVFDLAGLAFEYNLSTPLEDLLVSEYERESGDRNASGRLPAYKLMVGLLRKARLLNLIALKGKVPHRVGSAGGQKATVIEVLETERALSSTANRFLASACGVGEGDPHSSRLFAIDIDGMLENDLLGFSCSTPAGALALRTLKIHGFQPVLVSGRSLRDVVDRCQIFHLRAGVAEYGSVLWLSHYGKAVPLVEREELEQIEKLRNVFIETTDFVVDPAFQYSIRLSHFKGGTWSPVPASTVESVMGANGVDRLRLIVSTTATHLVGKSCNKGRGMMELKRALGARRVHAIGEGAEDLPLLQVSDYAYVPSDVNPGIRSAVGKRVFPFAAARRQQGFLKVARRTAHDRRRGCRICESAPAATNNSPLQWALGLRDQPKLKNVLRLLGSGVTEPFLMTR